MIIFFHLPKLLNLYQTRQYTVEIIQDDYQIRYDGDNSSIICSGTFRLTGGEYAAITDILNTVADEPPKFLIINLTELKFLNSSGINTLCKFIMRLRKNNITQVRVIGNNEYAWQQKSLSNFKKLLPSLSLEFE